MENSTYFYDVQKKGSEKIELKDRKEILLQRRGYSK